MANQIFNNSPSSLLTAAWHGSFTRVRAFTKYSENRHNKLEHVVRLCFIPSRSSCPLPLLTCAGASADEIDVDPFLDKDSAAKIATSTHRRIPRSNSGCLEPSAYEASTARIALARKEAITTTVNGNRSETQVPSQSPSSSVLLLLVSHCNSPHKIPSPCCAPRTAA